MKLVLAEKPSVAMSLSKVIGANQRGDGYMEGNGYLVSWCVGHLVELSQPEAYDEKYAKWRYDDLPILPDHWRYQVSASTKKQFGILKKLMQRKDVESLICATDAGREGELIFRLVYHQCGCKKPVERLWISSMEDSAIREGFQKLRPGTEYDALYEAALCRERADWIVGINATRLFSCLYGQTLNVGRVMTPTLAMVVMRDAAIRAFKPEPFYSAELKFRDFQAGGERMKEKAEAEKLVAECCQAGSAIITKVEQKEKSEKPPALFDLTSLQREANRQLGFTAQQTLDYTQALYEKKLVTYPRTDSRYLTDDMAPLVPELVSVIQQSFQIQADVPAPVNAAQVINSKKVTDHHAIIPTKTAAGYDISSLPSGEQAILTMLAVRLICAVGTPCHYAETIVEAECAGQKFRTKAARNQLRCPSPLSGKSKRKGGTHVKLTRHNGRAGKNGVYNPKHNDRSFDIANSEHIDEERAKQNLYWDCYNGFRNFKNPEKENELSATFEDVEQLFYRQRYRDFVTGQNERNVKNRHPERNKETGDLLKSKKTCPEETVYQIGTLDNHVPPELLIEIVTEFMEIVNERFGSHVHILNWALHLDESTPHIHERHVFDCENQYGEIAPQQEKALEALGFELPEPEKPVGRKNNRKMTFDSACRVLLFDVAKKHGLQLEEEPEYGGRAYLEKQDYILFKQKEQLAAQEQKLEELTMKIEDVEALVDEVADIAYDKAVEVVADTVKLETHKEDIKLVEQSKAWVLSPERKASKKEVEYAVKRLDGVIARITNAMKSTIQKIQTTLMKPEVKKAGTEQIKKKAKNSIIEQLSRKKKEIAEREVSRTDQAKSKKQDMEL